MPHKVASMAICEAAALWGEQPKAAPIFDVDSHACDLFYQVSRFLGSQRDCLDLLLKINIFRAGHFAISMDALENP